MAFIGDTSVGDAFWQPILGAEDDSAALGGFKHALNGWAGDESIGPIRPAMRPAVDGDAVTAQRCSQLQVTTEAGDDLFSLVEGGIFAT